MSDDDDGEKELELTTLRSALQNAWPELDHQSACQKIKAGEVAFDGEILRNPSKRSALPGTVITFLGTSRLLPPPLFVAYHKPAGLPVTLDPSPSSLPTAYSSLPHPNANLRAVGRLDKSTSGLLLFTTQGRWARLLADPSSRSPKAYRCTLSTPATEDDLKAMREGGVDFLCKGGTRRARPAISAEPVGGSMACVDLVITEGKHHQVRLMWQARGNCVLELHRMSFHGVDIGDLKAGECRELSEDEVAAIRSGLDC